MLVISGLSLDVWKYFLINTVSVSVFFFKFYCMLVSNLLVGVLEHR